MNIGLFWHLFQSADYLLLALPIPIKSKTFFTIKFYFPVFTLTQLEWRKINSLCLSDLIFVTIFLHLPSYYFLLSFSCLKYVRFHEKFCEAFERFFPFFFLNQRFVKPSFHFHEIILYSKNVSKFYILIFQNYLTKYFLYYIDFCP